MCRLSVAELRPGRGPTLYAVGGAGGATDELVPLVERLAGDPRVVALAVAAEPGSGDTIATLAATLAAAVRADRPHGPYRLLGYSFGGVLALEVAELLGGAGEAVPFLGMVDSPYDRRHWPLRLRVMATARRGARRARSLAGQPVTDALRDLRGRRGRAGEREGTTVQDANLGVLARWRPRVVDRPVTLFAATHPDFGCDLASLWRPWLPQLTVRRVRGNHLDLTQTPAGAARLARSVSDALGHGSERVTVLVATTFRWPGAARLAVDLHEVGCTVDGIAPRGSALRAVAAVRRSHPLGLVAPVRSLRRAIEASRPDLVVPFDDRTRQALTRLHAAADPHTDSGRRIRECIERSLGSPDGYPWAYSRAALMTLARESGVLCPPTAIVRSAADVCAWRERNPGPAVLKTDGSWGGRGIVVVRTDADVRAAWRQLHRRPPVARALKRLVVERDPWALRARLSGARPTLSVQAYVEGRPANAAIACHRGTPLGEVQAAVVESDGPTGPSTVLEIIDHPDIAYAVKSVVSNLELSGLCGLDFVLDEDGHAHLIELNPRATPTSHLVGVDGTDLLAALRAAHGDETPTARPATYPAGRVALFPQELLRDAASPHLRTAHHDVPRHAPDLVAHVLAGLRDHRRTTAGLLSPLAEDAGP
ncbi:MAG TPA: thioesterase domain-containing protein [Nocardioides sp.]|nr:thioesterase domain-containing protein [Nocardioides sp.]